MEVNDRPAAPPADADVAEEVAKLAAAFAGLVNQSLADLSPEAAARALRMAAELAEAAGATAQA